VEDDDEENQFIFSLVEYRVSVIDNIIEEGINGRERSCALTLLYYLLIRPLVVQRVIPFY
jgi:hypothetical protein